MAKFNVAQKRRRAAIAERKRAVHGDPVTGKLKQKPQPHSISGKRQRKLFKKWRREEKENEAMEKGLITMKDIEMADADAHGEAADKTPAKFTLRRKKSSKLQIKRLKREGKKNNRTSQGTPAESSMDAMVE